MQELVSPPWLWLFGACGAGKTATGFELYRQLGAAGHRVGFIDLDQLGMLRPDDDPVHAPIKAANLVAALGSYQAAGAEGVIVSGDLDGPPMRQFLDEHRAPRPVLVRLHASPAEAERRLRRRGAPPAYIERSRSGGPDVDADAVLDTSRLTVTEVVARIRRERPAWPPPGQRHDQQDDQQDDQPGPAIEPSRDPGQAVLICGPTPVGKSAVAWLVFMSSLAGHMPTAYLDLAQIGWLRGAGQQAVLGLKARDLTAMWHNLARQGARRLIISGALHAPRDLARYRAALPAMDLRAYHLTASPASLIHRALLRGAGQATELPGDDLRDQPPDQLERLAVAAAEADSAVRYPAGVTSVGTDDREPAEIAAGIAATAFTARAG